MATPWNWPSFLSCWRPNQSCVAFLSQAMHCRLLLILFQAMSHNAMACNRTEEDNLRYIMSAFIPRRQAKRMVKASRENKQFGAVLSQGRTVFNYANLTLGEEAMSHTLHSRVKIRFPKGFWQECSRLCFKRSCTYSFRNSLRRSLHLYMRSLRAGAKTSCGMLRGKKRTRDIKPFLSWEPQMPGAGAVAL